MFLIKIVVVNFTFFNLFVLNLRVVFFCIVDPISLVRDHRVKEILTENGIAVRSFNADLLFEPWEVLDDEGRPFITFTSFWDRCLSMPYDPEPPQLPPKRIISGYCLH